MFKKRKLKILGVPVVQCNLLNVCRWKLKIYGKLLVGYPLGRRSIFDGNSQVCQ